MNPDEKLRFKSGRYSVNGEQVYSAQEAVRTIVTFGDITGPLVVLLGLMLENMPEAKQVLILAEFGFAPVDNVGNVT